MHRNIDIHYKNNCQNFISMFHSSKYILYTYYYVFNKAQPKYSTFINMRDVASPVKDFNKSSLNYDLCVSRCGIALQRQ